MPTDYRVSHDPVVEFRHREPVRITLGYVNLISSSAERQVKAYRCPGNPLGVIARFVLRITLSRAKAAWTDLGSVCARWLAAARARDRLGGRPRKMDVAMLRMAMRAMASRDTNAQDLAQRLGITTTTLYMYVNGDGTVKAPGQKLLDAAVA